MSPLSIRLRELRTAKGLTQQQLADLADVRRATISDMERRTPKRIDVDALDRLCAVLRCSLKDLITLEKPRRKT
jgi:putative transcriptional regulator